MNTVHKYKKYGLDIFTTFQKIEGVSLDSISEYLPENDTDVYVELTESGVNLSAIISQAKISSQNSPKFECLDEVFESEI